MVGLKLAPSPRTPPIMAEGGIEPSGYCAYKLPQMSTFELNEVSSNGLTPLEPPIIAEEGIELSGYCAYKLPQISTRLLKDASPETKSLLSVLTYSYRVSASSIVYSL